MTFSYLGVFAAGLLTFLSPCVLPLAPILMASLMLGSTGTRWGRLRSALWFVAGFTVVFVLMGLGISAVAPALGRAKPWLLGAGGVVFALFGLRMMRALPDWGLPKHLKEAMSRSFHAPELSARIPKGAHGVLFGALFGLSWTPCVGPVLGGVLTYVASRERSPAEGAALLASFAAGIGLPLLVIAAGSDRLAPMLARLKKQLPRIEYAAGLGLFVFGIYTAQQARFAVPELFDAGRETGSLRVIASNGASVDLSDTSQARARMLFFYSEHCPVCRTMEPFLPAVEKSCASTGFELLRVSVDRMENAPAADRFGVRAVPTIAVLNASGAQLVHLVGFQTQGRLIEAATTVSQMSCTDSVPRQACEADQAC